jgi:WD40 repeat protein
MLRQMWNGVFLACLVFLCLGPGVAAVEPAVQPPPPGSPTPFTLQVESMGIFPIKDKKQLEKFTISPDGCRFAYVHKRDGKQAVILDGKQSGPEWDLVVGEGLFFSPDSSRLAYIGRRGDKRRLVVDGVPGPEFDGIAAAGPVFSPDNRKVAYLAKRGAEFVMVLDGQVFGAMDEGENLGILDPGPRFTAGGRHLVCAGRIQGKKVILEDGQPGPLLEDRSATLALSPDGAHVAYWGLLEEKWHPVVDGRVEAAFDRHGRMAYSPDGSRLAYTAIRGDHLVLCVTGEPEHSWIGLPEDGPVFSPDGRHVALAVEMGDRKVLVVDEQLQEPGVSWNVSGLAFSPDGRRLAYIGSKDDKDFLVVDGKPFELLDGIRSRSLCFSPDSRRVFCIGYTGDLEIAADWYLVEDGRRSEGWSAIWEDRPEFSSDGSLMAYHGGEGNQRCLVINGTARRDADYVSAIRFSPDGKHWACVARREGKKFLVVDGKSGPAYEEVANPSYSPDGNHVAYRAAAAGQEFVVLDSRPLPAWDMILDHGPTFRPDGTLEFTGMNADGSTGRVRVTFAPKSADPR